MNRVSLTQPLQEFELLEQDVDGRWVKLRFHGPFEGSDTLWDATFKIRERDCGRNIIEIGQGGSDGRSLTVILALPRFDLPAIRKTIIMVRQYKRLHVGRIEFG